MPPQGLAATDSGDGSLPLSLALESMDPLNDVFTPPRARPRLPIAGLLEEVRGRLPPRVMAPEEVLWERRRAMRAAQQRRRRQQARKVADALQ